MKNPAGYTKMHDGSWDFDLAVDMLYSFWSVTPLSIEHPKVPSTHSPCLGQADPYCSIPMQPRLHT